ncbi:PREDICTED: acyl-CoA-binding domain-containing protein 3-like isoform X2 [Ipomoea nil]|uniref:acyl-CoA-binding domain-containing protein 3-like isoform X2 n=1 Tax=Ipomoea nil TaxID=35883 RepID=UPI0009011607|nr:PREDICTED: acyl-CoA-binding domain-containing protein 3-like isoform X2 [Ipomoea nil]
MDLDIMLFQELAFTVGLSVVIYFILCKFHSNASLARDNKNMGFCCVDEGIVGGDDERVEKVADQGEVDKDDEIVDEVVDESPVRRKLQEIEVEGPLEEDFREIHIEHGEIEGSKTMEEGDEEVSEEKGSRDKMENEILREEGVFDDEWEGIERTDLEKAFGTAVVFVDSKANADQLDNGVKMQLYGLHKVATDGPCCTTQPMALKLSARAKWNAWQRLGDISREEAMEQYIALLSRSITNWKDEK